MHARDGLLIEDVPAQAIAAQCGTPTWVISAGALRARLAHLQAALADLPLRIHYAVKANDHLAILKLMAQNGAGADVVSGGELLRALHAGHDPAHIVFSGVGKQDWELKLALERRIGQINVESAEELTTLSALATAMGTTATIALRINPDIDAGTHAKITTGRADNKFGIAYNDAAALYAHAATLPGIDPAGIALHIGSQILSMAPFHAAYRRAADLVRALRTAGQTVRIVDCGGGLGIDYRDDPAPRPEAFAATIRQAFGNLDVRLAIEPGRWLAAPAGLLLSSVILSKTTGTRRFVVLDAAHERPHPPRHVRILARHRPAFRHRRRRPHHPLRHRRPRLRNRGHVCESTRSPAPRTPRRSRTPRRRCVWFRHELDLQRPAPRRAGPRRWRPLGHHPRPPAARSPLGRRARAQLARVTDNPTPPGLTRKRRLAQAALWIEQVWPAIWPALGILGLYAGFALLDGPAHLPPWPRIALAVIVLVAVAFLLWHGLRRVTKPTLAMADRRLERDSNLPHRPLATLADRPADPTLEQEALWRVHIARLARTIPRLTVRQPRPGLARRDIYALRGALIVFLVATLGIAGADAPPASAAPSSRPSPNPPPAPAPRSKPGSRPPPTPACRPSCSTPTSPPPASRPAPA